MTPLAILLGIQTKNLALVLTIREFLTEAPIQPRIGGTGATATLPYNASEQSPFVEPIVVIDTAFVGTAFLFTVMSANSVALVLLTTSRTLGKAYLQALIELLLGTETRKVLLTLTAQGLARFIITKLGREGIAALPLL